MFKAIEALIMMGQRGLPPSFALTSGSYAVSKGQFQETWDELVTQCGSSRPKLDPSVAMTMSETMRKCLKIAPGVGAIDTWVKGLGPKHRDLS